MTHHVERRFAPASCAASVTRAEDAAGDPVVTGYAAVFWNGSAGTEYQLYADLTERLMPGAFDRAIREAHDVRALVNHDPNMILGRTTAGTCKLKADRVGLRYEIQPGNTTIAADLLEHLRRGDMTGSSFSFEILEENFFKLREGLWCREILDVRLYDVGPVTFPAYEATTSGLRHAGRTIAGPDLAGRLAGLRRRAEACTLLAGVGGRR